MPRKLKVAGNKIKFGAKDFLPDNMALKSQLEDFFIAKLIGSNYIVFNFYYLEDFNIRLVEKGYFNWFSADDS